MKILYRQWIPRTKTFHYWGYVDSLNPTHFIGPAESTDSLSPSMLTSGLTDINGQEIFAGDIVTMSTDKEGKPYAVLMEENTDGFGLCRQIPNFVYISWIDLDSDDRLEIIGNQFQNPELWKKIQR